MLNPDFTFIPRKLGRSSRSGTSGDASIKLKELKARKTLDHNAQEVPTEHAAVASSSSYTAPDDSTKTKNVKFLDDNVYTILFELALSDHSLWSNQELLQMIEANEEGFVPVSYLTRTSPYFTGLPTTPPESNLIRSIRASEILEGRLAVSSGVSLRDRHGKTRRDLDVWGERNEMGLGFEVRRKDWVAVKERVGRCTTFYWEIRTVYVENIPYRARMFHTIYEFIHQLLPKRLNTSANSSPDLSPRIQSISFPPHHKDPPDAPVPTTGKGFAFVILSSPEDVDYLIEGWPWEIDKVYSKDRRPKSKSEAKPASKEDEDGEDGGDEERNKVVGEAMEYGFRCLSKRRWDELKEEYLALQRRLLEETIAANEVGSSTSKTSPAQLIRGTDHDAPPSRSHPRPHSQDVHVQNASSANEVTRRDEPSSPPPTSPDWFPKDCLVFIKNVHPETNKTTLRTLFSSAFDTDSSISPFDYIDYNKGLDSCYIRLSHPDHARALIAYFSEHKKVQMDALDSVGTPISSLNDRRVSAIEVELVQGKKEELYWEKVPEKIRKAALVRLEEKEGVETGVKENGTQSREDGDKRKRKRRKRY